MKVVAFGLGLSVALAGLTPAVAGPFHAPGVPGAPAAIETVQYLPGSGFPNPRIHDVPVDWCSTWSTNCGPGGATLFCGIHGFAKALSWTVISTPRTYVIGSSRYCEASYCKGYGFIRCG